MSTIVISRKWNGPKIYVSHDDKEIRIEISRNDFAKSFAAALVPPTFWQRLRAKPSVAAYETAAQTAFDEVVEEAKMATMYHPMPGPQSQQAHENEVTLE